ncbi:alpha/beta hydrolase [Roseisalinus antarcticus]|uniref:Alpha/beta hydrolase fold protein n=1 Tax=Roseisalinus antarcticus TaxID=254357 RepID=A0A1Y5T1N6_9RHOB|nr:alpha/beta hydrolase [Roseisalinus antarcticus]SLN53548.1 alpha/beta hydrolase fold protein [Roseisalinus antarcticus]
MTAFLDPEELNLEYLDPDAIPDAEAYPPRWAARAEAFRDGQAAAAYLGLPYGPDPRQWTDIFRPAGEPKGLLVFIHGGYWMSYDPRSWSHLAAGAIRHGWAVAMPCHRLAPDVRMRDITADIRAAIDAITQDIDGPVILAGHSAGGHLAARMLTLSPPPAFAGRLRRVVPISPLGDLRPLVFTTLNDKLRLDAQEAREESPALAAPQPGVDVHVWVGASESPAFLWQARRLAYKWKAAWTPEPGKHHFDVIEGLADPDSALTRTVLGLDDTEAAT